MRRSSVLSIDTVSDIVLLSNDAEEHDATGLAWKAPETYIRGTVNVALNKPKVLKSLQVDLVGTIEQIAVDRRLIHNAQVCRQNVVIEGLTSAYGIRQSTSVILSEARSLQAGEYRCDRIAPKCTDQPDMLAIQLSFRAVSAEQRSTHRAHTVRKDCVQVDCVRWRPG